MKTYTVEEFKNSAVEITAWQQKEIDQRIALASEILTVCDCFVNVFTSTAVSGYGTSERTYVAYEGAHVKLNNTVRISRGTDKKFDIFDERYWDFRMLGHDTQKAIKDKFTAPNQIGVLTAKKVNDWLVYWDEVIRAMDAKKNELDASITAFYESLQGLPVTWYRVQNEYNKIGEIRKGGLLLKIEMTNGRPYLSIDVDARTTVENFKVMSDNKYIK